jgi:hypothetical protein
MIHEPTAAQMGLCEALILLLPPYTSKFTTAGNK